MFVIFFYFSYRVRQNFWKVHNFFFGLQKSAPFQHLAAQADMKYRTQWPCTIIKWIRISKWIFVQNWTKCQQEKQKKNNETVPIARSRYTKCPTQKDKKKKKTHPNRSNSNSVHIISISSRICGLFFIRLHWLRLNHFVRPFSHRQAMSVVTLLWKKAHFFASPLSLSVSIRMLYLLHFFFLYGAVLHSRWCWSFQILFLSFFLFAPETISLKWQEPFMFEFAASSSVSLHLRVHILFPLTPAPFHPSSQWVFVGVCVCMVFVWLVISLVNGS